MYVCICVPYALSRWALSCTCIYVYLYYVYGPYQIYAYIYVLSLCMCMYMYAFRAILMGPIIYMYICVSLSSVWSL